VILGTVPALVLLRGQAGTALKSAERGSSRGASRVYATVVMTEVALACVLLVSSALLVRTVGRMMQTPVGVDARDTLITTIQLTRSSASQGSPAGQWQAIADLHARIVQAIRDQPGGIAAGLTNILPLEIGWRMGFFLQGQPAPANPIDLPQAQLHISTRWARRSAPAGASRRSTAVEALRLSSSTSRSAGGIWRVARLWASES
jgi:hypothetical protein